MEERDIETRLCKACDESKPLTDFYVSNRTNCKECVRKRVTANRQKNIERVREYDRKRGKLPHRVKANTERTKQYRKNNPRKWNCHKRLNNALRSGKITQKPCAVCGTTERVEAHHFDYSKPLEVIWLCSSHHTAVHMGLGCPI